MKISLKCYLAALLLTAIFTSTHPVLAQNSDVETLRNLKEVEWPNAYRQRDTLLLDRILAPEFQVIGSDGTYATKNDQLDFIRHHHWNAASFRFIIKRLDVFENGSAIVTGTGYVERLGEKGPTYMEYQSSNFFVKRDGRWRVVASHTSGDKVLAVRPAALTSAPGQP